MKTINDFVKRLSFLHVDDVRRVVPVFVVLFVGSYSSFGGNIVLDLKAIERARVLAAAGKYLTDEPITITAYSSPRSAGGLHDFFSEGDYWWADPKNPDGPYIQRDGMTNPDNFVAHRKAMIRLSLEVPALTAAYKVTGEERYAAQAVRHLIAWFVADKTKMNPHLKYAQAIKGRSVGRGTGIIDTIHLVEVARAVEMLEGSQALSPSIEAAIKRWFSDYLDWLTTSENGIQEREAKNNHGTCWVMQVAAFSHLVGDTVKLEYCRDRFKEVLLPNQMSNDGSFPLELKRTKPYGYSLFNLDAMATTCQILSTPKENLWEYTLPDGRNMHKGIEFMYPYILDKSKWPYASDVMFFQYWPVRQPSLLFAGLAYDETKYVELWKRLDAGPINEEVIRNWPIRQPLLWLD